MPEVNGHFTYEALLGQELDYEESDDNSKDMDLIDEIEENDNQDDHANDDESTDTGETDNDPRRSTDQGA